MVTNISQSPPYPIVVVTGANTGVGFGICQRLLTQLSRPSPPDVSPRGNGHGVVPPCPFAPTKKITLVLACRNAQRANAARQRLFTFMDAEVSRQRKSPSYNGHAEDFRRGLSIDHISLDLTSMESVFKFAEEARRKYPYVTHLILNAAMFPYEGLYIIPLVKQSLLHPVGFVTTPRYVIQPVGSESQDGLGFVWQSNVFGHYCLARLMEPLLLANPYLDSRVEWMSSVDVEPFDPHDLQLRHTKYSYQVSKYQIDLICTALSRMATKAASQDRAKISYILVQPGVCHTDVVLPHTKMASAILAFFMVTAKLFFFYLARVLGSRNHPILPDKGAFAPVYASLAPATVLQDQSPGGIPRKFGTHCSLFGRVSVGVESVRDWEENEEHASDLVKYCEDFFLKFMGVYGDSPLGSPIDSGIVCS